MTALGAAGLLGVVAQANATTEREREALESRVAQIREIIGRPADAPSTAGGHEGDVSQWLNWPNWNNWNNWVNWNNWGNWGNWFNR